MPEITFYVLATKNPADRYGYACKLVEKAYRSGSACYLLTDTIEQSRMLDELLWTFRPGSFIPHELFTGELPELKQTSLISHLQPPQAFRQTLVNLSGRCPDDFLSRERILEVLIQEPTLLAEGRQRYRQYQQAGLNITTHTI